MFVVLSNGGKYHGRMDESMMIKFKVSYTSNTNQSKMDCILEKKHQVNIIGNGSQKIGSTSIGVAKYNVFECTNPIIIEIVCPDLLKY